MTNNRETAGGGSATSAFGRTLRRHREGLALSQEDLAGDSGVAARTISDLERGVAQRPRSATVRLLAAALGLIGDDLEAFKAAARAWRLGVAEEASEPVTRCARPAVRLRAARRQAHRLPACQAPEARP